MEVRSAKMRLILVAAIIALSAACGSSASPAAPTPLRPTFALTGTVVEARGDVRTPARNIPVEISPTHRTVTGSDGSFSIRGLAAGTYELQVRGEFYEPLITTVRIEGDTRIDLEIVPLPVYAVSGIVYEDIGNGQVPVPGVLVNNSDIHSSATTDASGAYRVFALRGTAAISFTKAGYVGQGYSLVMERDVPLDVKLVRR